MFVQLTTNEDQPVTINVSQIVRIQRDGDYTRIITTSSNPDIRPSVFVQEDYEKVLGRIRQSGSLVI